jgi:predicted enzyme related to lactoylglutathione lyase
VPIDRVTVGFGPGRPGYLSCMQITTVMAQLIVADADRSVEFYSRLFGRVPDANPMAKLYEWHFDNSGAIQVYEEPIRAGGSGATIGVSDLDAEVAALDRAGIAHEPLVEADYVRVVQLADPDLNRIVLTGAK